MESEAQSVNWETRFPGKGEAITRILGPFYEWKPEFKLVLPDIEARAEAAIFWRRYRGVRVYRVGDLGALWESLKNPLHDSLMRYSIRQSLRVLSFPVFLRMWWLCFQLGKPLRETLNGLLRDSLFHAIWKSCRVSDGAPSFVSFLPLFWCSLHDPIVCQCGFLLAGKTEEAAKFQPLLDLWLAGNFPVGFDAEGNLLVLVAD